VVPAGFERGGGEAQPGGGFAVFPGRLQDLGAVLGPQLVDGLAAPLGIRLVPDRHVAAGQLARVDLGHGFSMGLEVFVSRFDGAWGAAVRQFPAGNRRTGPDRVDTAAWSLGGGVRGWPARCASGVPAAASASWNSPSGREPRSGTSASSKAGARSRAEPWSCAWPSRWRCRFGNATPCC